MSANLKKATLVLIVTTFVSACTGSMRRPYDREEVQEILASSAVVVRINAKLSDLGPASYASMTVNSDEGESFTVHSTVTRPIWETKNFYFTPFSAPPGVYQGDFIYGNPIMSNTKYHVNFPSPAKIPVKQGYVTVLPQILGYSNSWYEDDRTRSFYDKVHEFDFVEFCKFDTTSDVDVAFLFPSDYSEIARVLGVEQNRILQFKAKCRSND